MDSSTATNTSIQQYLAQLDDIQKKHMTLPNNIWERHTTSQRAMDIWIG